MKKPEQVQEKVCPILGHLTHGFVCPSRWRVVPTDEVTPVCSFLSSLIVSSYLGEGRANWLFILYKCVSTFELIDTAKRIFCSQQPERPCLVRATSTNRTSTEVLRMAPDSQEQHAGGSINSFTETLRLAQSLTHDRSLGPSNTTAQTGPSLGTPSQSSNDQSSQDPAVLEQNRQEISRVIKDNLDGNVHLASTPGIRQAITDECAKWNPAICGRADFVAKLRFLERERLWHHLLRFHDMHDQPSRQSFVVALSLAIQSGSDWQPDRRNESPRVDANDKIFTRLWKACADRVRATPVDERTFESDWLNWQRYTLEPIVHTLVDVGYTDAELDEQMLANLADGFVVNAFQKWYVAPE